MGIALWIIGYMGFHFVTGLSGCHSFLAKKGGWELGGFYGGFKGELGKMMGEDGGFYGVMAEWI